MEDKTIAQVTETPITGDGVESTAAESKSLEPEKVEEGISDHGEIHGEGAKDIGGEQKASQKFEDDTEGEHKEDEHMKGAHIEGELKESENIEGENMESKFAEGQEEDTERVLGEGEEIMVEGETMVLGEGEELMVEGETKVLGEGEELIVEGETRVLGEGEELMVEGETKGEKQEGEQEPVTEYVEEEDVYVEEPPPDPAAPFNFRDSEEMLRDPFTLRPDQLAEIEQLWEIYQNYTPSYTDIENYITDKELLYMLKSLMLMTVTEEQFYELIEYCVRPPHPKGHITFDQFVKIVTLRQRDFPVEDELRKALRVFDPDNSGEVNREHLKEVLSKQGYRMPQKQLDNLIKEVDLSNDGVIGIEDVVGTLCIDLNREDIELLRHQLYPNERPTDDDEYDN